MRVGTSGKRSWFWLYRFQGQQRRITYGTYPEMSLADAGLAHATAKQKLEQGIDPAPEKIAQNISERTAPTVAELCEEYLERHARKHKKSAGQDERTIKAEIVPAFGKRKAKSVTRRDIIKLLDRIEDRGAPVMRNRTASLLSKLFLFAMDRGIVDASPAVSIRRLPEQPRDRFLSMQEIHEFWHGLESAKMSPQVRTALRLLLVTGQRRGEVAGLQRDEIDDAERIWMLPGERAKPGRPNIVPLSDMAMQLISQADENRVKPPPVRPNRKDRKPYDPTPSPWLFPSTIGRKPVNPEALTRAFNRCRTELELQDVCVHDLRRTFRTWHAEIGTPKDIVQALMNHSPRDVTDRVYNRSVLLTRKSDAMDRWANWLDLVVAGKFKAAAEFQGADVLPLAISA